MGTVLFVVNLLLLIGAHECTSKDTLFVVPSLTADNVEFYDLATMRMGIHLDKVTFQEAKEICTGRNGTLLEYNDEEELAEFVAEALGESAAGTSLWIGGEYTPATKTEAGEWRWLSGENIIKKSLSNTTFPMSTHPYWVDRPNLNSTDALCLITDRFEHKRPLITGLPCWVKRPFICTVSTLDLELVNPKEVFPHVSTGDGRTFHLFHAESTWMEALNLCRDMGYSLAVVNKEDQFIKLQHRMRRARPIIENAWTSGAFLDGKWVWASTNEEIPTKPYNETQPLPPWYRPGNITMEGCLLADRHVCDYFVYVEARCDRRRSFICHEEPNRKQPPMMKVPGSKFYLSTVKLSWAAAQKQCARCLQSGTLLQLAFHDPDLLALQVEWLVKAMTELAGHEIRHIWLNGRLHNNTFTWGNNETYAIQDGTFKYSLSQEDFSNSSKSLLKPNGENGFIIFCPGDFKTDPFLRNFKCLNMDRENIRNFYMYGLTCEYKQHFICIAIDGNGPTYILDDGCNHAIAGKSADDLK